MSWMLELCALYEANASRVGKVALWKRGSHTRELVLLPIGHTTAQAQIEVIINEQGEFVQGRILEKGAGETFFPATETSAARTSGVDAMPLFDKLIYVAGDYTAYIADEKGKAPQRHAHYLSQLKRWCESPFAHHKVQAVYTYVQKGTLVKDLINCGVLQADAQGMVSDKVKINNIAQVDAFVRFRVYAFEELEMDLGDPDNTGDSAIWLDRTVQRSFISFVTAQEKNVDLCYLSGERVPVAKLHPAKLRGEGDTKAKLISANDDQNFTYRGRFLTKEKSGYNEAVSIGYETSQKLHNALKWLIRRQGYTRDGLCTVAWESTLQPMPDFYGSALSIADALNNAPDADGLEEDQLFGGELDEQTEAVPDTNYTTAMDFQMALDGFSKTLQDTSKMRVLALDSATPGRLAMTYYREMPSSRYLDNIGKWHQSCCWKHGYFKEGQYHIYEGCVSIREIAKALYGTEQNKRITLRTNSDGKCPLLKAAFDRLRPCILDGAPVPVDMVRTAVRKASNPQAYEERFNYDTVLHIACALVRRADWEDKQRHPLNDPLSQPPKGAVLSMKLDPTCTNRSYLFGRLLAVAEKVERATFEAGEQRITNAERYMQNFSQRPLRTYEIIRRSIQPYLKQLQPGSREFYKNMFAEIEELLEESDFRSGEALDGMYLAGYDCQRTALKANTSKKDDGTKQIETTEGIEDGHITK